MRQWLVNPEFLCRQHLLGEHQECHTFMGCIKKGTSLKGYIKNGLVEVHNIKSRHDELAMEMIKRGYNHKSPLEEFNFQNAGYVNREQNIEELKNRCLKCKMRIENFY